MNVTIKDVAKLAEVSISTVSRVTNGASNVAPEIREKVEKAIKQLNYKPNKIAQSLSAGRLKNIGIIATRSAEQAFVNPYFSTVLQGIGSVTEKSNYELLLSFAEDETAEINKCLSLIDDGSIQGLILLSSRVYDRLINKLIEIKFPFVLIGRVIEDSVPEDAKINYVDIDNFQCSFDAVMHLINQGHKNIGCIHAPFKYVVSQARYSGYCMALRQSRIPQDDRIVIEGGYSWQDTENAVKALLQSNHRPSAIFATDDLKAIGVMKAAQSLGLKIPEDLSIIGFNNFDITRMLETPISTVHAPIYDMGKAATEILLEQIKYPKNDPKQVILPTKLIIRNSVLKKL